jgi:hypothetical protein
MNDLRHVVFAQQADEKEFGGLGISVFLQENVEHISILIHGPPQPVRTPSDLHVHLVQMPPRTPSGFAVAQLFSEQGSKLDVPLSERFVADLDAALMKGFLNIPLAEWQAVVQPQGVADDAEGKPVAIGLAVRHSSQPTGVKLPEPWRLKRAFMP